MSDGSSAQTLVVNGRTLTDVTSAERVRIDLRPPRPSSAPELPAAPAAPAPVFRVTQTPPGPDGRPRAPRREVELQIEGYPGFALWIWANYPQPLRDDLTSGEPSRIRAALLRLVVEHNGWCDADGEPFPPAAEPVFWDAIPTELSVLVARAIVEAPAAYPNSLSPTAGR